MVRIIAFSLTLLLGSHLLTQVGFLAWFKANQSVIAQTLCINSEKPELKCNGNCFLAQKLKKLENERSDQNLPVEIKQVEIPIFILPVAEKQLPTLSFFSLTTRDCAYAIASPWMREVFHPPELS